jgi:hypothetical protein
MQQLDVDGESFRCREGVELAGCDSFQFILKRKMVWCYWYKEKGESLDSGVASRARIASFSIKAGLCAHGVHIPRSPNRMHIQRKLAHPNPQRGRPPHRRPPMDHRPTLRPRVLPKIRQPGMGPARLQGPLPRARSVVISLTFCQSPSFTVCTTQCLQSPS